MAAKLINSSLLSCTIILYVLLNTYFLLSHAHSPKSNTRRISPSAYLHSLIGSKKGHESEGLPKLKKYLSALGYMKNQNDPHIFDNDLETALKSYQKFYNLEQTGSLDHATVKKLSMPRCGVPDVAVWSASQTKSRNPWNVSHYVFLPSNPKWPDTKRVLSYAFPPGTRNDVQQAVMDASAIWSDVSDFRFTLSLDYDSADIKISFQQGAHGDGVPFDGPGGILAHSNGPNVAFIHFDGAKTWVDGIEAGKFDLQTLALHELGHTLGLGHTNDSNAIMYPDFDPGTRKGLGQDDIDDIWALYAQ